MSVFEPDPVFQNLDFLFLMPLLFSLLKSLSVLGANLLVLLSGFDSSLTFPFKGKKKQDTFNSARQLRLLPACQAPAEDLEDQFDSLIKDFHCLC